MSEYKCLFYKDRTCHVREYVGIADNDLQEEKFMTATERETRTIADEAVEPIVRKFYSNTTHWLVREFCGICPHREA